MSIRVSLPYPPAVNNLFRNVPGRGRVRTSKYKAWVSAAAPACYGAGRVEGRYVVTITADRPDRRARDLGNLEKATADLLVHVGIVEDDHLAERIVLEWSGPDPIKNAQVHVVVEPFVRAT